MRGMHGRILTLALLVLACALGAAAASGSPQSDFNAVYGDWKPDHKITACKFSQRELQSAYDVATGNPDFQYETGFRDDVQREIARWKAGGCAGVSPLSKRKTSPLYGARIVRVHGRGKAAAEYVKIKNRGKRTLSFKKATLRNRKRGRATFPARFKLRRGKTALVRVGCARGKGRASFKGTRVWLCHRSPLFSDSGDVARLVDAKGIAVSQRGYGTQARRIAY